MAKQERVRVDVRLSPNDRLRIEELAIFVGVSMSAVVKVAIKQFLDRVYTDDGYIRHEVAEEVNRTNTE